MFGVYIYISCVRIMFSPIYFERHSVRMHVYILILPLDRRSKTRTTPPPHPPTKHPSTTAGIIIITLAA